MRAYYAIAHLGMGENLHNIRFDWMQEKIHGSMFQEEAEKEIRDWLNDAYSKTEQIVEKYWAQIERLAKMLLEHETVTEKEINQILHSEHKKSNGNKEAK